MRTEARFSSPSKYTADSEYLTGAGCQSSNELGKCPSTWAAWHLTSWPLPYEQYQNFQNQQKTMEQDIRDATIRNAITKDRKSVDDLKKAGYSEQEIKDAFFGRRKVIPGFEDEIPADWKSPAGLATIERDDKGFRLVFAKKEKTEAERRAEEEAREAAKERARKQAEFALQLEDEAVASRKSGLTGYARDVAEMNTRIKKGTTYLDKNGIEQVAPLTQAAWQSVHRRFTRPVEDGRECSSTVH